VEVRRPSGGDITNEEWRTLTAIGISGVVQRWHDWYTADRPRAARVFGGGENAVNQARRPMRLECSEMGVKIHPFGLPLLLVNVRDPHQWRAPCL
jgi:hypothetical protein